jgi:hypothetical protein
MIDDRQPDDRQPDDAVPAPTATDAALLAELGGAAARVDPVPADLVAAARGVLTWRTVDEELAELTFDSLEDGLVGVRSAVTTAAPRQLSFEAGAAAVEVELADGRLIGQLVPPGPARVELHHGADVVATRADDLGRFSFDVGVFALPDAGSPAPCRLRVDGEAFRLVTTWFTP